MEIKDENIDSTVEGDVFHTDNPSLDDLEEFLRKVGRGKEKIVVNEKNGRVKYSVSIKRDKRKYAKFIVYDGWLSLINQLDKSSIILLFYILNIIKVGDHRIKIMSEEFCELTGFARPTFYSAITQLVKEKWLYKSTLPKIYFINIRRFHRGPVELIYQNREIDKMRKDNKGVKLDELEY